MVITGSLAVIAYGCVAIVAFLVIVATFLVVAYYRAGDIGVDIERYCPSFDIGPFSIVFNPGEGVE